MNPVLSLTLSLLLFTFITNLPSNNGVGQILDTNGNPVLAGGEYYIFPAGNNPKKGGLRFGITDNSRCPVSVLQNNAITGLPVKFTIPGNNTVRILTDTDVDIEFTKKPNCAESVKWRLVQDQDEMFITIGIGGPGNYPDVNLPEGNFIMRKHGSGNVYKFEHHYDPWESRAFFAPEKTPVDGGYRLYFNYDGGKDYLVSFVDAAYLESGVIMSVPAGVNKIVTWLFNLT